jgi:hypothetical protein
MIGLPIALMPLLAAAFGLAESTVAMLDLGIYEGGDLPRDARAGEWLALCPTSTGAELKLVRVKIRAYRSEIREDRPSEKTGREVTAPGCPKAYALLRSRLFRPRRLETAVAREGKLVLRGTAHVAAPTGPSQNEDGTCGGDLSVEYVLSVGERRQILLRTDTCARFTLRWAGDLDGDGRLDLLLEENLDSGAIVLRLFLSRGAGAELVRKVAEVQHGGC